MNAPKKIAIVSTGGTIEKTYDELSGVLHNQVSVLDMMLASLTLNGVHVYRVPLMNKDSLEMKPEDHAIIARAAGGQAASADGVIVVHGTDRLAVSGEACLKELGTPTVPIVFTGAMRPWEMRNTDALQNLTESLTAVQILSPGVYAVFHNRVLEFPGVIKDPSHGTFCYSDEVSR